MEANRILSALDPQDREALTHAAARIGFDGGRTLCRARDPANEVFFPISGFISIAVDLNCAQPIEVAMVGSGGAWGLSALFGQKQHLATGIGRLQGQAWAVPARALAEVADRNARLKEFLSHYHHYVLAQVQQTAACNARHQIRQRMASWLLRASLTTQYRELQLTQNDLGGALGVQRASISQAAVDLANAGAIDYRRGKIAILDVQILDQWSCACHRDLAKWRSQLLLMNDHFLDDNQ